jgi:hypothetical protein
MEYWNDGILGIKAEINHFKCEKLLQTHYSMTPSFHYSNWAKPKNLFYIILVFSSRATAQICGARANAFRNNATFGASTGLKNFFSSRYQSILYQVTRYFMILRNYFKK